MNKIKPIHICTLKETNEHEVTLAVKLIEEKKGKIQLFSKSIKEEVDRLHNENMLLDKEIKCITSSNNEMEKSISALKSKTCELASSIENIKWKMFKTDILKVFENEKNDAFNNKRLKYNEIVNPQSVYCHQYHSVNESNNPLTLLKESIKNLTEDIERRKNCVEMIDPKLDLDIQMLNKRNGALLTRYQRQLQEAESRLRQMHSELNSFKNLLSEKEALLTL